ncbi:MAG TPA: hypothetical protein VMW10_08310 [Alphaproteobacteria bacterium]|nr:hypothetical protein [Alphaproteobacteria bacterium]
MNKLLFSAFSIGSSLLAFSLPSRAMEETTSFVDWTKRPTKLVEHIDESASNVYKRTTDWGKNTDWGHYPGDENNGSDYGIMGIPDHLLVGSLIQRQPEKQTWCFMDFGAGNGAWGRSMAAYLTDTYSKELKEDTKRFYIFSLTGDILKFSHSLENSSVNSYQTRRISSESQVSLDEPGCTVYEWGRFKIECLAKKFPKLQGKVDGIFSFATFRHLPDSLGTYSQTWSFLNEAGVLATDEHVNANVNGQYMMLPDILTRLGLPYVICPYTGIQGVITWKSGVTLQKIPQLSYTNELISTQPEYESIVTSPVVVCFSGNTKEPEILSKLRFSFEEGWGYFPKIPCRRSEKKTLEYMYNSTGYKIFEQLIQPGASQISKYAFYSENLTSKESVERFYFGLFGMPEELRYLDLEGLKRHVETLFRSPKATLIESKGDI